MAYDAIVCLIASGRLRAHSSCADTFFSLSWLNLCFQLRVTLMLRKTLVLNSGVMFSKLISQTCKGHSTKPHSVPLSFSPRQCQCQCASHDRPINNHGEQISELQRGTDGWWSGEEWAGVQHEGREKSQPGKERREEGRGLFSCPFCTPSWA